MALWKLTWRLEVDFSAQCASISVFSDIAWDKKNWFQCFISVVCLTLYITSASAVSKWTRGFYVLYCSYTKINIHPLVFKTYANCTHWRRDLLYSKPFWLEGSITEALIGPLCFPNKLDWMFYLMCRGLEYFWFYSKTNTSPKTA